MTLRDLISDALARELRPLSLQVDDESHLHAGHAGSRDTGETHFRVQVVSEVFVGKTRLERHRIVNATVSEAFDRGLHALAIKASAPDE